MNLKETAMQKAQNVNKILFLGILFSTMLSCKAFLVEPSENNKYEILNIVIGERTPPGVLSKKTYIPPLLAINESSYDLLKSLSKTKWEGSKTDSWDFNLDSLFNEKQRKELDDKIRNLQVTALNKNKLSNKKAMTGMKKMDYSIAVSDPIIQVGDQDILYGFIFVMKGWSFGLGGEENLLIFRKDKEGWKEIRKTMTMIS